MKRTVKLPKRRSISTKVAWIAGLWVASSLVLITIVAFILQSRAFEKESHLEMETYASLVEATVEPALLFQDREDAETSLLRLCEQTEVTEVHVFNFPENDLFVSVPSENPTLDAVLAHGKGYIDSDTGLWHVTEFTDKRGQTLATVAIHSSLEMLKNEKWRASSQLLGLSLIIVLATLTLGFLVSRSLTKPIISLASNVEHIEAHPYKGHRVQVTTQDEVGGLAESINKLLDSLEKQTQALHRNEARLKQAQSFAKLGNWLLVHHDQSMHWSDEVFKILELEPDDSLGTLKRFLQHTPETERPSVKLKFIRSIRKHEAFDHVHPIRSSTGKIKWVHEYAHTTYGDKNVPLVTTGIIQDVTQRMEAEQEIKALNESLEDRVQDRTEALRIATVRLRASETRLDFLITSSPAITYSSQSTSTLSFDYISENITEYFGFGSKTLIDNPVLWQQQIHPNDRERVTQERLHPPDTGSHTVEYRFKTKSGEYRWLRDEFKQISAPSRQASSLVGCWLDITELKAAQKERERLIADLRHKNQELEQFTYTVSHDLKSPLITISGFLGIIERNLEKDPAQSRDDLKRVANAATHMTQLLNDLLELSRIGRVRKPSEPIQLKQLVLEVRENLKGLMDKSQGTIRIADHLPEVFGDRTRITQVLQNLLENAIKYRSPERELSIHVGWRPSKGSLLIFIKDNGL